MCRIILFFVFFQIAFSQNVKNEEIKINDLLSGSLFYNEPNQKDAKLIILIAGSGPTDRNGNQQGLENNSLKFLAEELAQNNFTVFSYDKRIFAQMKNGTLNESKMSFTDFIEDAIEVAQYFRAQKKYSKIVFAGHSEGSLIGMVASQTIGDGFISIAGAGRPINEVLLEQIEKQAPFLKDEASKYLDLLKNGQTFAVENQMLAPLFRESVQPYMISWIKYNPQIEIKRVTKPVLILNGTNDMQVSENEAKLLKEACVKATLTIIKDMNHVLKIVSDEKSNVESYSNASLPIAKELVESIKIFLNSI